MCVCVCVCSSVVVIGSLLFPYSPNILYVIYQNMNLKHPDYLLFFLFLSPFFLIVETMHTHYIIINQHI